MRQRRFLSWLLTLCLLLGMFGFPAYAEKGTITITQDTPNQQGIMTITLIIPMKTPAASDFTYSAPMDLAYSNSNKEASVVAASGVNGMGTITVKYYSDAGRTTQATPRNVNTYYVGITVSEGDWYVASTSVIYGDDWTFAITASTPDAPAAPTKASATKSSVTLNPVSGCEYSKDGTNWQSGTEFAGLTPGTEYTFYQRLKRTSNTNASPASSAKFSTEADTYSMIITLKIKAAQTITASDVKAAYGETNKSVSASVTNPVTGGGGITYTVKDGSEDYISVASDGKLTIKKVPPVDGKACVIVTAAETDDYAETSREVTVTVSRAEVTVTALDQNILAGDTVPDLSAPVPDTHYAVTGLVGSDTLTTAPKLTYQKNGSAATPDNSTAGTYDIVPSCATANDNYSIRYTNGTLTIKVPATVTIVPAAKNITYNGFAQELVTAGEASGGTMLYALGTDAVTAPADNLYTPFIPTFTDAGTNYVWYKASGNAEHADSTPKSVTAEIKKANVTVTAKDQTVNEGGEIAVGLDMATLAVVPEGHVLSSVTLTGDPEKGSITPSAAVIKDAAGNDVSGNYEIGYEPGKLNIVGKITRKVTFKVANGSWDDGTAADKYVILTGFEGDTLKLAAGDIPAVGSKPADTYKAGTWDNEPKADAVITEDVTYTYTYAKKTEISAAVTFRVVNGTWDDGTAENKTVILKGYEGDTLKLTAADIPAAGNKPAEGYEAGTWDTMPVADTVITADTAYTYTYAEKEPEPEPEPAKPPVGEYTDPATGAIVTITEDGNAIFEKPAESVATVTVPDAVPVVVDGEIAMVPVTAIAPGAFEKDKKLTTVTIGKNVVTIGKNAFSGCAKLTAVKGGKGVKEIAASAFANDKKLKSLPALPALEKIGDNAFKGCITLTKVTIGAKVKTIGKNAFYGCRKLKTITIKTTLLKKKSIGKNCFKGIYAKAAFKCPEKLLKNYKKWLLKPGKAPKTAKFK